MRISIVRRFLFLFPAKKCLLAYALLCSGNAFADTCMFPAPGGNLINFGIYSAANGNADGQGQITFTCLPTLPNLTVDYVLTINKGSTSTSFFPRQLGMGAFKINYNLYRDPGRLFVIGDGSAGTSAISASCTGLCMNTIYARIPAGQSGPAGNYSDSILVSVEFMP